MTFQITNKNKIVISCNFLHKLPWFCKIGQFGTILQNFVFLQKLEFSCMNIICLAQTWIILHNHELSCINMNYLASTWIILHQHEFSCINLNFLASSCINMNFLASTWIFLIFFQIWFIFIIFVHSTLGLGYYVELYQLSWVCYI